VGVSPNLVRIVQPQPPTEIIERPAPGTLARGVWEAPPWVFYASAGVVLLAALLYGARRAGFLRRR
jgi:hypothetical protein